MNVSACARVCVPPSTTVVIAVDSPTVADAVDVGRGREGDVAAGVPCRQIPLRTFGDQRMIKPDSCTRRAGDHRIDDAPTAGGRPAARHGAIGHRVGQRGALRRFGRPPRTETPPRRGRRTACDVGHFIAGRQVAQHLRDIRRLHMDRSARRRRRAGGSRRGRLPAGRRAERHHGDRREQAHSVLVAQPPLRGIDLRYREFHHLDR